jgi:hypothetical protein
MAIVKEAGRKSASPAPFAPRRVAKFDQERQDSVDFDALEEEAR